MVSIIAFLWPIRLLPCMINTAGDVTLEKAGDRCLAYSINMAIVSLPFREVLSLYLARNDDGL